MDREAELRAFVAARGAALSRAAFLLTGDHQAAEDLVQDTYAVLVRRWQKSGTVDPEAYVRRILYSRFVDSWRRRRLLELPWSTPPDGDEAGTATDRLTFRDALKLLTPRQRGWLIWPRGISDGGPSNDERRPTPCRRRCHIATS